MSNKPITHPVLKYIVKELDKEALEITQALLTTDSEKTHKITELKTCLVCSLQFKEKCQEISDKLNNPNDNSDGLFGEE